MFHYYEMYEMLALTKINWRKSNSDRRYANMLRDPRRLKAIKSIIVNEIQIGKELHEHYPQIPWSIEAHCQSVYVRAHVWVYNEIWRRNAGISTNSAVERFYSVNAFCDSYEASMNWALTDIGSNGRRASALWEKLLICFYFLMRLRLEKNPTVHIKNKIHRYDEHWRKTYDLLMQLLACREDIWARVLEARVTQIFFVDYWNSNRGEERAGDEMRKQVEMLRVRERLRAYNDLVPRAPEAPWAELGIASRFEDREAYPDALIRLQRAVPDFNVKSNILKNDDPDFDEDFEDFRRWVRSGGADPYLKEEGDQP